MVLPIKMGSEGPLKVSPYVKRVQKNIAFNVFVEQSKGENVFSHSLHLYILLQGLLVAILYCFVNKEVRGMIRF